MEEKSNMQCAELKDNDETEQTKELLLKIDKLEDKVAS